MEISSPPYPKNSASPRDLYRALGELYRWTAEHRDWANLQAERLEAPDSPFVPTLGPIPLPEQSERFLNLAVPDMFMSWQGLRKIRERYDDIVRNYETETDWESDACIFHRINIVKMAAALLSMAFLDYEHREAKGIEMMAKSRKAFLRAFKHAISEMHSKFQEEHDDDDAQEDDYDDLFNTDR